MLKFHATAPDGREILGIGISRANVEHLIKGEPIHFNAEQMGLSSIVANEVVIFFGETEDSMREEFESNGLLDNTRIIDERNAARH